MPAVIEVEIKTSCPGMVNVEILDKEHTVLTEKIENTGNPSVFRMEISDAKLWDCDHPNHYTLRATFGEDVGARKMVLRSTAKEKFSVEPACIMITVYLGHVPIRRLRREEFASSKKTVIMQSVLHIIHVLRTCWMPVTARECW